MKQGIYIVVSPTEIVKAEMSVPDCWGWAGPDPMECKKCIKFQEHCLSLPRIPIQGEHNWKVWQGVKEGKEFRIEIDAPFPEIAIPIEQTKSEQGEKSELLSVNEAGAIAAKIAETVSPALSAHEQALFVAGFQECIKYLSQQNNLLTNDKSKQTKSEQGEKVQSDKTRIEWLEERVAYIEKLLKIDQ